MLQDTEIQSKTGTHLNKILTDSGTVSVRGRVDRREGVESVAEGASGPEPGFIRLTLEARDV